MENIGIIREIDNLGRLCIPKEMRTLLGLKKEVELIVTPQGVLIRNPAYVLEIISNAEEDTKNRP